MRDRALTSHSTLMYIRCLRTRVTHGHA